MPEWIQFNLEALPDENAWIVVAGLAGLGLLYCYLGYPLFRVILGLSGFLIAGAVAAVAVGWLSRGNLLAMGIALGIGGLCGAMALFWLYRLGVFCLGVVGALAAAQAILGDRPEEWAPYAVIGAGIAGGLLALLIERPVMTLATAALGATLAVYMTAFLLLGMGFQQWLENPDWRDGMPWILLGCWAFLACTGALTQFYMRRRPAKK